jgi:TonB-dependent starch-binding outer membrane protein SusC
MQKKCTVYDLIWKVMKITMVQITVMMIFSGIAIASDNYGQEVLDREVSLNLRSVTLRKALSEIESVTKVKFVYSRNRLKFDNKVSLDFQNKKLGDVLDMLFLPLDINYAIQESNDYIVLTPRNAARYTADFMDLREREIIVSGTIRDASNMQPVPGVNIIIKGTSVGTTSDASGQYALQVPDENAVLVFSFIGFATQEVLVGSQTTIDVQLMTDVQSLQEIVVVGYGEQKRSDVVGSVASVNITNALTVPTTNLSEMLRGAAPGVQITLGSARPGGSSNILIRGERSIQGGNSPLIILDGFPIDNINDVNAEDIASIEVLKDASSQAIYGARASNGVILITTKKGRANTMKVSLHSYATSQKLVRNFDLFSPEEFAQYRREARRTNNTPNNGTPGAPGSTDEKGYFINDHDNFGGESAQEWLNYNAGNFADWENEVLKSAHTTSHTVTLSGGGDNTKVFSSIGYFKQSGLIPTSGYERGNFRLNLDQRINRNASLSANINFMTDSQDRESSSLDFITISPFTGPYDQNGDLVNNVAGANASSSTINPLWTIREADENVRTNLYNINVVGSYQLHKNLSYRVNTLLSNRFTDEGSYRSRKHTEAVALNGKATVANSQRKEYLIENILTYNLEINKDHVIDITAVQSANQIDFSRTASTGTNFPNDLLGFDGISGALNYNTQRQENRRRILSLMGRVRYTFKDKYLLTLTGREDGSSVFAEDNKKAFFPAVAVAWKMHNEKFLSGVSAVNELKVRASYGSVGNQAINPYQTLGVVGTNNYIFGGVLYGGSIPGNTLPNPNLKWETSTTFDAGLDFGLFENRVVGAFDYYTTTTTDLLLTLPVPQQTGYTSSITNGGESKNSGIELMLTGHIIKKSSLNWSVTTSYSKNTNEIVKTGLVDGNGDPRNDINNNRFIGSPINVIYAYQFDGIFQTDDEALASAQGTLGGTVTPFQNVSTLKAGAIRLKDVNGDGVITLDDKIIIRTAPKWFGSVSTNVRFRNFDLLADFYIVEGAVRNNPYFNGFNEGGYNTSVRSGIKRDYWTPENPSNSYPRPNFTTSAANINVLGIDDASYVRLRTLSLGYTLPASVLSRIRMSNARIYATATNLLTITDYKSYSPENNPNDFPDTRGLTFGVNLGL